mmetsp:Transcript_9877/g.14554  ORF Transcript_9877/g.14554 Transcript_9877/m.14554 type:complete len:557 (-) Transcript_9877:306-1976(-)
MKKVHSEEWCNTRVILLNDSDTRLEQEHNNNDDNNDSCSSIHTTDVIQFPPAPLSRTRWMRRDSLVPYGPARRTEAPTLSEIGGWQFDVLRYERPALVRVFSLIVGHYGIPEHFCVSLERLDLFSKTVMEWHNPSAAYHNWYHGVSCCQMTFCLLKEGGADQYLTRLEVYALLLAALVHDVDHAGHNNDFEIKSRSLKASIYKNDAVLENHSIKILENEILKEDGCNLFEQLVMDGRTEEVDEILEKCRNYILWTDPARHGTLLKELVQLHDEKKKKKKKVGVCAAVVNCDCCKNGDDDNNCDHDDYTSIVVGDDNDDNDCGHAENEESTGPTTTTNTTALFWKNSHNCADESSSQSQSLLGPMIIHAADISNPVHASFPVVLDWCSRISTEFALQASRETELGLEVSPYMDGLDDEYRVAIQQVQFYEYMAIPYFRMVAKLLDPPASVIQTWCCDNQRKYRDIIARIDEYRNSNNHNNTNNATSSSTQQQNLNQQQQQQQQQQDGQQQHDNKQDGQQETVNDNGSSSSSSSRDVLRLFCLCEEIVFLDVKHQCKH